MNFKPLSFFKKVVRRLGLDPKQGTYFFHVPNVRSAKGSMIALAAVFMLVMAVLIPVAMTLVATVRRDTSQAQLYVAGAQNAAKAGLEDALGWFVRQKVVVTSYSSSVTQGQTPTWAVLYTNTSPTPTPVYSSYPDDPFNPQYNSTNPQYSDTFQAVTVNLSGGMTNAFYGICNEYPVDSASNSIPAGGTTAAVFFGRYEVMKQPNPTATPGTPVPSAVHDISGTREVNYVNGDGLVWAITSMGYIYKRADYRMDSFGEWTVPYNVYPNKVLATAKAYTELRKLSCNLPNSGSPVSYAAVYCSSAANVHENGYSYLNGKVASGYALCAMSGATTLPAGAGTTNFFGSGIKISSATNGPISDVNVFGMSIKDIQFIADYVGSSTSPLSIVSADKLSYYNGDLNYAATQVNAVYQRLNSSGILIVNGNLTLGSGGATIQPSFYSGIVFCTGNMTISGGSDVDGIVIMGYSSSYSGGGTNQLTLNGAVGNYAYLNSNPNVVTSVLSYVAQYREDISARRVLLAFPGI
jgi:hypothetical protein